MITRDPQRLARMILERHGYLDLYRTRPRLDLSKVLAQYGLEWHRRPFTRLAGALVGLGESYHVVTNSRQNEARQRFSAAHELKHFLTDRQARAVFYCTGRSDSGLERAANVFARELLMAPEVVEFLLDRGGYAPEQIGRSLGVSAEAAGYRLRELVSGQVLINWDQGETRP